MRCDCIGEQRVAITFAVKAGKALKAYRQLFRMQVALESFPGLPRVRLRVDVMDARSDCPSTARTDQKIEAVVCLLTEDKTVAFRCEWLENFDTSASTPTIVLRRSCSVQIGRKFKFVIGSSGMYTD